MKLNTFTPNTICYFSIKKSSLWRMQGFTWGTIRTNFSFLSRLTIKPWTTRWSRYTWRSCHPCWKTRNNYYWMLFHVSSDFFTFNTYSTAQVCLSKNQTHADLVHTVPYLENIGGLLQSDSIVNKWEIRREHALKITSICLAYEKESLLSLPIIWLNQKTEHKKVESQTVAKWVSS